MEGWIKLHRQFINWEWYDDNNTKILFLHLMLTVNHKDKKYRGKLIKRGEIVTSYDKLANETHLSVMKIRTCLKRLKSTNEITIKTSSKGTVIQLVKYGKYQTLTNEVTNKQQTNNKQITTNNNVKNNKNEIIKEKNKKEKRFEYVINGVGKLVNQTEDHLNKNIKIYGKENIKQITEV